MPIEAVLLDLDDTLLVEVASADEAIYRACLLAVRRYPVHPDRLHESVRRVARREWYALPEHPYAEAIAISSWEALWARFEGDDPALVALRAQVPAYRRAAWRGALGEHGIVDPHLADEMARTFVLTRQGLMTVYEDVPGTLAALRPRFRLGIVTNGLACLQRDKLRASGLEGQVDAFVAAGDIGQAKPHPAIFRHAMAALDVLPADTVMVGNSLHSDIAGGRRAGLRTVWLNRQCAPLPDDSMPNAEIESLDELPCLLG
ncbi:MAG: HAD family hydrolase [Chloroflexi bacterium]|nr:HAD family hydrolase [Chloroflexota bacterium]